MTEPRETCLGYATNGVYGKGINELAQYIINQIYYEDNHLINEIKRIEDIKLYIDNVADDRVSDIYTNVIRGVLLRYTEEQCDLHGIPLVLQKARHIGIRQQLRGNILFADILFGIKIIM